MSGFAWVTLATNDSYSLGALVLAHSLRQVGTAHQLAVLITPGVTNVMRKNLADVFNIVEEVNLFDSKDEANLRLLKRPELGVTFTKLHCWRLTQFEKCVFLDADVLVLANSDELFERDEFSAAPDVGWPDCFNSGVFVYRPSLDTYGKLVDFAVQKGSFDGGDQGLLNAFFSDWAHKDISKHLPFIYNMCSTASYSYMPAFKYYGANVKIVHFIGPAKPWLQYFDTESRTVHPAPDLKHLEDVLQRWWDIFCSVIHPKLSPDMSGLAGAFAQFTLGEKRSESQDALENHLRRQAWEVGNIDYMGRDSFDNIWSKICQTLTSTTLEEAPVKDGAFSSGTQQVPEVTKPEEIITEKVQEVISQEPVTEIVDVSITPTGETVETPKEETKLTEAVPEAKEEIKVETPAAPVAAAVVTETAQVSEQVAEPESATQDVTKLEEIKNTDSTPVAPKLDEKPQEGLISQEALQEEKLVAVSIEAEKPKEQAPTEVMVKDETTVESPKVGDKSSETTQSDAAPVIDAKSEIIPEAPVTVEPAPKTGEAPKEESSIEGASPPIETAVPKQESSVDVKIESTTISETKEEVPVVPETVAEVATAPIEPQQKQEVQEEKIPEPIVPAESPKTEDSLKQETQVSAKEETEESPKEDITPSQTEVQLSSVVTEIKPQDTKAPVAQTEADTSIKPESIPEAAKVEKTSTVSPAEVSASVKVETTPKTEEAPKTLPEPKIDTTAKSEEISKAPSAVAAAPIPAPKLDTTAKVEVPVTEPASPEAVAEPSSPVPKSDTEPKETKKKIKKVKKVVKKPAGESSDASAKK